jgi:transposase
VCSEALSVFIGVKTAKHARSRARVRESGERSSTGKEARGDKWLKWILIEAAWSHIRFCPKGHLARVFQDACRRKGNSKDAIKVVARKLVNVIWAVWTYEKGFMAK